MLTLEQAIEHCHEKAEELKKKTDCYTKNGCGYLQASEFEQNEIADCLECANEHEQLAGWLTELKERREADRWIPVSERLPEYRHAVLVYCPENENVYCAFHDDKHWCVFGSYETVWQRVTHWRPLPKPYESEGE